ncbi:MAG: hypothetical protein HOV80_29450, partial [Polyangiaceae bacterium]|nr:hypothetical protein [Polyangiaceae bacterium]
MTSSSFSVSLPLDPNGMRETHTDAVDVLDKALLASFEGATVMHAFDPTRMVALSHGGPPLWSVGVASHPSGAHQFLTYGLSRAVDPASPFNFELALRVRSSGEAPMWPTLLLRTLARYHLTTGREIKPGQFMDLGGPISQVPCTPEERHTMPTTRMTSVFITAGAKLPTPRGPVEIRNVLGLDPDEQDLLTSVHAARFVEAMRQRDPSLSVALDSPSLAAPGPFRDAMEEASRREGSDCTTACAIPGFRWEDTGKALEITIPATEAKRLHRRIV